MSSDPENMAANETYGVMKAKQEKYIYITAGTFITLVASNDCNFTSPKARFFPTDLGFPIQKRSPYKRIFDQV